MSIEKTEYEFPDEKAPAEQNVGAGETPEFEVEVVDDTPPADRNRTPSEPPAEPTEEELRNYSADVQKRFKHFTKGYHDERRAKEKAEREREEAVRVAQAYAAEVQKLRGSLNEGTKALVESSKTQVETEVATLTRELQEAYEAFDSAKVAETQVKLNRAVNKLDRLENFQPPPVQETKTEVQPAPATPQPSAVARSWQQQNSWFGRDQEMTSLALGLHARLVSEGVQPDSDTYYSRLNAGMRKRFPEAFSSAPPTDERRQTNVVAPASRSTAPNKIVLTKTQVQLANKLGVPLKEYARQIAIQQRNEANG